jgi:hypothetical protein
MTDTPVHDRRDRRAFIAANSLLLASRVDCPIHRRAGKSNRIPRRDSEPNRGRTPCPWPSGTRTAPAARGAAAAWSRPHGGRAAVWAAAALRGVRRPPAETLPLGGVPPAGSPEGKGGHMPAAWGPAVRPSGEQRGPRPGATPPRPHPPGPRPARPGPLRLPVRLTRRRLGKQRLPGGPPGTNAQSAIRHLYGAVRDVGAFGTLSKCGICRSVGAIAFCSSECSRGLGICTEHNVSDRGAAPGPRRARRALTSEQAATTRPGVGPHGRGRVSDCLASALSSAHSRPRILVRAFSSAHSRPRILASAFSSVHSRKCILVRAFSYVHSRQCILVSAFSSVHSRTCILASALSQAHSPKRG